MTYAGEQTVATCARAAAVLFVLAAAAPFAQAQTMPDGAAVWMTLESNACWDHVPGHNDPCAASAEFGPSGGIPMQTYGAPPNSWVTGFAQAAADGAQSYLLGYGAGFLYISMRDTYTVHGAADAPFSITARLAMEGVANSIWQPRVAKYFLSHAGATVEIGNFYDGDILEQFRVQPFSSATTATWDSGNVIGPYASMPFLVATSHSRTVETGDVFELGFGANIVLNIGELDAMHTTRITFDLPDGIWLTSRNGAVFGTPPIPEPATWLLLAAGLPLLVRARALRRGEEQLLPGWHPGRRRHSCVAG